MGKAPRKLSESKSEKLNSIIDTFITEQKSAFSIADLKNAGPIAEDPLFAQVPEEELLSRVRRDAVFSKDGQTFKSRRSFFKNARFLIVPTEEEVRRKILIPGHRFLPFQSMRITPWDCTLVPGASGSREKAIPTKVITKKTASLYIYFTLAGQENVPTFLTADHEENAEHYHHPETVNDAMMKITVFDFSDFFDAQGFAFGDALICTVKDWAAGNYTFEYLPRKKQQKPGEEQWARTLEKGFKKTFDLFGLKIPIDEQIAYGYFFAGTSVLKDPAMHLGGFINTSKQVHMVSFGMDTHLWPKKEISFTDLETMMEGQDEDDENLSPLDRILKTNEFPFSESVLEAFMLDELFQSKGSAEAADTIMKRFFNFDEMPLNTAADEKKFKKLFNDLWKKTRGAYNYFADQQSGIVRSDILSILEQYYKWLDKLPEIGEDLDPEDFPVQIFADLVQMAEFLAIMLGDLKKDPHNIENITAMKKQLSTVSVGMEELQEKILEKGQQAPKTSLRVVKSPSAEGAGKPKKEKSGPKQLDFEDFQAAVFPYPPGGESEKVYILDISLEGIQPRIWRQLRVPGSYTLGDLHDVIQIAMGWEDDHLHAFTISSTTYGVLDEDEDEYEYTLDSLKLRKRQKITYLYDFGDSWEHQIVVSDTLPAGEKEPGYPECLGGERACPPEDCGGAWGYKRIREACKKAETDEQKELLEWVGDYDPEEFDLKELNKIFKWSFK